MVDLQIAGTIRAEFTVNGLHPAQGTALAFLEVEDFDAYNTAGDGGWSWGLFQVNTREHGDGAPHHWQGLAGTRAAMRLMMGRWTDAAARVGIPYSDDPVAYLYRWAPIAQGSVQPSRERCQRAVDRALALEARYPVKRPPLVWIPAHPNNYRIGRVSRGITPYYEAGFCHTTDGGDGTVRNLGGWFANPAARASTTFGVGQDGEGAQFVSLRHTCFAQGIGPGVTPTAAILRENAGHDINTYAFSIELCDAGRPGEHTPKQLATAGEIIAWMAQDVLLPNADLTGFMLDRSRILGHYETGDPNRQFCPSFPPERWETLIGYARDRLAGGPVAPPPEPPAEVPLSESDVLRIIGRDVLTGSTESLTKAYADLGRIVRGGT